MARKRSRWSRAKSWFDDHAWWVILATILVLLLGYAFTARKAAAQPIWTYPSVPLWDQPRDVKMGGESQ